MGLFQRQLRHHDCKKNSRLRIEGETKRIEDVIHIVVGLSQKKSPRNIATNIIQFHSRSFLSNLYFWITNQQIIFEYFRLTALFKNWKISISIWWFWKISISIRQFCKISISIKYRIDSNLAYRTGLGGGEGAVAVNFAFSLFIFVWRILLLNRSATTWRQATNNWRAWKTQNSRLPPTKGQSNPDSSNNVHIVGDLFPGSEMPAVMFIFLIDLGLPTRSLSLDLI